MTKDELLAVLTFLDALRGHALTGLGLQDEDPYWNMTLFIMRRHLEGKLVTVTTLASASLVPYASAMRRIDEMLENGLIFKRPRTATGRSFSLHPTPELIQRFEGAMKRTKMLVGRTFGRNAEDDPDGNFFFGGSYMGVRVVASPSAMKPPIGRCKPLRLLCQNDPTFQVLLRLNRELQEWLGGPIEIMATDIDTVRELALANAGNPISDYDIVAVDMPWIGEYAAKGVLLPLDELIARGRINLSDFHPASWQGAKVAEHQYAIPIQTMPELLFYRTDLMDQYQLKPPETVEELLHAARELTSFLRDRYGIGWCGRRGTPIAHSFLQIMAAFGSPPLRLRVENGEYYMEDLTPEQLRPAFDSPAAEGAADFLLRLKEYSPPNVSNMAWEEGIEAYATGRVAMLYGWSCRASRVELDPNSPARGVTGYLPHPHGPQAPTVSPMGGYLVGVPANIDPRRIDLAWRVIEWLTSPEAMKLYVQNGSFVSPRFSVSADPDVTRRCKVITAVDRIAKLGQIKLWPRPPVPGIAGVIAVLGEEIHDMFLGRQPLKTALQRAQSRSEAILEQTHGQLEALLGQRPERTISEMDMMAL